MSTYSLPGYHHSLHLHRHSQTCGSPKPRLCACKTGRRWLAAQNMPREWRRGCFVRHGKCCITYLPRTREFSLLDRVRVRPMPGACAAALCVPSSAARTTLIASSSLLMTTLNRPCFACVAKGGRSRARNLTDSISKLHVTNYFSSQNRMLGTTICRTCASTALIGTSSFRCHLQDDVLLLCLHASVSHFHPHNLFPASLPPRFALAPTQKQSQTCRSPKPRFPDSLVAHLSYLLLSRP